MLIYICDDVEQDRIRLLHSLKKYSDMLEAEYAVSGVNIAAFESADALIKAFRTKKEKPDLIFLDIYMQGKDGMEAAKILRNAGCTAGLIFVTSSDEHAIESYDVDALYYLKKPYTKERLLSALHKCRHIFMEKGASFKVNVKRKDYAIPYREILYFEKSGHDITVNMRKAEPLSFRASMNEISAQVSEYSSFVPVGKSYLVNLNYAEGIRDGVLLMQGGTEIPIPRRLLKDVQDAFDAYKKKTGG